MGGQLRRTIKFFRGISHCQPGRLLTGIPGSADAVGGPSGALAQGIPHAKTIERPHRIGREIDVGAHAQKRPSLLEYDDLKSFLTQRDCRREAADAAADDSDRHRHDTILSWAPAAGR